MSPPPCSHTTSKHGTKGVYSETSALLSQSLSDVGVEVGEEAEEESGSGDVEDGRMSPRKSNINVNLNLNGGKGQSQFECWYR